jgi:NAD(P)-dependent dehydrogenase (short-subunit alcohol dehydrogenase family)
MTVPTVFESTLRPLFGLSDKNALVTGASQGIGKETARLLLAAGAKVMLVARRQEALKHAADELARDVDAAKRVFTHAADVAQEDQVIGMFNAADNVLGPIDILVNNAGSTAKHPLLETTVEQWDESQRINLRSVFLCTREAAKAMRRTQRRGVIVNVSSLSSESVTVYDNAHYGSAKAGVNMLTRNAASELAADGIRVNAVLPGGVSTEGARSMSASGFKPRGPMAQPGRFPMARLATPREIAAAVLYLASPASGYVTGQLLVVDGGFQVL